MRFPVDQAPPEHVRNGQRVVRTALAPIAAAQFGVVLFQQAADVLPRRRITAAVGHGDLVRLWHGAYALPPVSLETRLRAAELTLGPDQIACLDTAAALHGFDLSGDPRLHLLAGNGAISRRPELVLHRIKPLSPLLRYRDQALMAGAETAVRVAARQRTDSAALAVMDAALASRAVARKVQLAEIAERLLINGIQRVRRVVNWADSQAESPRESWLRWLFLDGGLPPPVTQFWVRLADVRYRLDLAWPQYKVGCEYDGTMFHTGQALYKDRRRLNDLTADGWLLTFATQSLTAGEQGNLVAQVAGMLRSRGASL